MKIIKQGKIPEEKEAEFSCNNCKSMIRARMNEGDYRFDQRDGDFIRYVCPVCKQNIYVTVKKFK